MNSFLIVGTVSRAGTLKDLLKTPADLDACDMVELRFDEHMDKAECLQLCKDLRQYTKVLLTIRTSREGGTWDIDDDSRLELFRYFIEDVDMVDIELKSDLFAGHSRDEFPQTVKVIASYHHYTATPAAAEIQKLIDSGKNWGADIVKLAVLPTSSEDVNLLESFLKQKDLCMIGMGDLGITTRSEFPQKGSVLTYGYIDQSAAPGQLSAKELNKLLR